MKKILFGVLFLVAILVISGCSNDYNWDLDDIQLMKHSVDGTYGCFGCSSAGSEPALCVDPVVEMVYIEETEERYCNSDFSVVACVSEGESLPLVSPEYQLECCEGLTLVPPDDMILGSMGICT